MPLPPIDGIIPLRDQIRNRAPKSMTKRYPAIHTPRSLPVDFLVQKRLSDLLIILKSLLNRTLGRKATLVF
jgi:hypothetical protein